MRYRWTLCASLLVAKTACTGFSNEDPPSIAADGGVDARVGDEAGSAPDASADACSFDLENDPHSCGACGHDCLGAACSDGRCVPTVLSSPEVQPFDVVVSGDVVAFRTVLEVRRVSLAGGAPVAMAAGAARAGLALNDGGVYHWQGCDMVRRSATDLAFEFRYQVCSGDTDVTFGPRFGTQDLFFYVNQLTGNLESQQATFFGGSSSAVGPLPPGVPLGFTMVGDVPVVSTSSGVVAYYHGAFQSSLATEENAPHAVVGDDAGIYWAIGDSGADAGIRVRAATGGAQTLEGNLGLVTGLALDDTNLYATVVGLDEAEGTVLEISRDDGRITVLAAHQRYPSAIAVTDKYVVWANRGSAVQDDGAILRVPK